MTSTGITRPQYRANPTAPCGSGTGTAGTIMYPSVDGSFGVDPSVGDGLDMVTFRFLQNPLTAGTYTIVPQVIYSGYTHWSSWMEWGTTMFTGPNECFVKVNFGIASAGNKYNASSGTVTVTINNNVATISFDSPITVVRYDDSATKVIDAISYDWSM
jgi:hypothetical protein